MALLGKIVEEYRLYHKEDQENHKPFELLMDGLPRKKKICSLKFKGIMRNLISENRILIKSTFSDSRKLY